MDTHPDIVRAISTALGAVAGSLTGDRTKGPEKGISGFIYAENTNSYNKVIAYSACTTWKVMGLKLFMLLMVPLALFVYVYFADNLTQRLFLGMLVIILGQIGDYLLFKETQRILINTVKYEMTEEFNKKLAHEKFKFQIRMMGLSVIVFMGIISCLLAE